ncbi:hypothetical protein ACFL6I_11385 [candidate division KSB1 bacterium]
MSPMSFTETIPLHTQSRPGILKNILEKILSPRAEKTQLVELSRERIEELIEEFSEKESRDSIRQDILRRFEKMNGEVIPKNADWVKVQDLFEAVFKPNTDERARQILSEGLGYPRELLTEVMYCVGRGQKSEEEKEPRFSQAQITHSE